MAQYQPCHDAQNQGTKHVDGQGAEGKYPGGSILHRPIEQVAGPGADRPGDPDGNCDRHAAHRGCNRRPTAIPIPAESSPATTVAVT